MVYWLYNNKSQKRFEKLSISEVAEILLPQSEIELNYWFAWQKGWTNWKLVKDIPDLMNLYKISEEPPALPPPPPPISENQIEPNLTENTSVRAAEAAMQEDEPSEKSVVEPSSTLDLAQPDLTQTNLTQPEKESKDTTENINKRLHKRHNIRFKVIIESDVLTFRSFTSNISLGGLALEHSLPDKILTDKCKIYISDLDNTETIMFNIKPVRQSGSDLKYFSFENLDDSYQKKLEMWMSNHSKS